MCLLANAKMVFATLGVLGRRQFLSQTRKFTNGDQKLAWSNHLISIIVDEAAQAVEAETFVCYNYNPSCLTLVGDPNQLSSTVVFCQDQCPLYKRSLFERLMNERQILTLGRVVEDKSQLNVNS